MQQASSALAELMPSRSTSNNVKIVCGGSSIKGRRPQQEDVLLVHCDSASLSSSSQGDVVLSHGDGTGVSIVGVFDGHGGKRCSRYASQHLPENFYAALGEIRSRCQDTGHGDERVGPALGAAARAGAGCLALREEAAEGRMHIAAADGEAGEAAALDLECDPAWIRAFVAGLAQAQQDLMHRRRAALEVRQTGGQAHCRLANLEHLREIVQSVGEGMADPAHWPAGDDEGTVGVRVPALAGPNAIQKAHAAAFSEVRTKRTS